MNPTSLLYKDSNLAIINKPFDFSISDCQEELIKHLTLSTSKMLPKDFYVSAVGSLDRAVSGIQVFSLNPTIARVLNKRWNTPRITQRFLALVKGDENKPSTLKFALEDGQKDKQISVTSFAPVKHFGVATLLKVWTETDYKHQIRRQFSKKCMNIVGDRKYGHKTWNEFFKEQMGLERIFLHAHYLSLELKSYNRTLEINCALPSELKTVLEKLACYCPTSHLSTDDSQEKLL